MRIGQALQHERIHHGENGGDCAAVDALQILGFALKLPLTILLARQQGFLREIPSPIRSDTLTGRRKFGSQTRRRKMSSPRPVEPPVTPVVDGISVLP